MRGDQGFLMSCERILEDERLSDIWADLRIEYARACTDLGITLARRGRIQEGRPYLRKGIEVSATLRGLTLLGLTYIPALLPGRTAAAHSNDPFAKPVLLDMPPRKREAEANRA